MHKRSLSSTTKVVVREIMKVPYQFTIKNPEGETSYVFDEFEGHTAFADGLNL